MNATSASVADGILDVNIDLPRSARNANVLVFTVEYDGVHGAILVDHRGNNGDD